MTFEIIPKYSRKVLQNYKLESGKENSNVLNWICYIKMAKSTAFLVFFFKLKYTYMWKKCNIEIVEREISKICSWTHYHFSIGKKNHRIKTYFLRRFMMENVVFYPFGSHAKYPAKFLYVIIIQVFSCLLQYKIPLDIIFLGCVLKHDKPELAFQKRNFDFFFTLLDEYRVNPDIFMNIK